MLIQYISQPATPEAKISHIGLIFRKYTPAKVMAHIMILMLFFQNLHLRNSLCSSSKWRPTK